MPVDVDAQVHAQAMAVPTMVFVMHREILSEGSVVVRCLLSPGTVGEAPVQNLKRLPRDGSCFFVPAVCSRCENEEMESLGQIGIVRRPLRPFENLAA